MNAPRPLRQPFADTPDPHGKRHARLATSNLLSRSFEVAWLGTDGRPHYDSVRAPASPAIDATCANLVRGAVVATSDGPVPVEDLDPGMKIMTSEYGPVTLQWIGSYTDVPDPTQNADTNKLIRVVGDTFGLGKPSVDLMLSPKAHVLVRQTACKELFGKDYAYAPIRAFEDGVQVIGLTPRAPVTLYNLAFDRQATISANGVELETFHPAPLKDALFEEEVKSTMLRLFPHISSFAEFGRALTPRLTTFELRRIRDGA